VLVVSVVVGAVVGAVVVDELESTAGVMAESVLTDPVVLVVS
jgi:hypothetical protein